MNCENVKKIIPAFLEEALDPGQAQSVKDHLLSCAVCAREMKRYEQTWDMLTKWKNIEPSADYVSRFWTVFSQEPSWHEQILLNFNNFFLPRKRAPSLAAFCVIVIVVFFAMRNYQQNQEVNTLLAALSPEDLEVIENIDLAQHFDLLDNWELIEDWDALEELEALES